jgi:hypothetical protein
MREEDEYHNPIEIIVGAIILVALIIFCIKK